MYKLFGGYYDIGSLDLRWDSTKIMSPLFSEKVFSRKWRKKDQPTKLLSVYITLVISISIQKHIIALHENAILFHVKKEGLYSEV